MSEPEHVWNLEYRWTTPNTDADSVLNILSERERANAVRSCDDGSVSILNRLMLAVVYKYRWHC